MKQLSALVLICTVLHTDAQLVNGSFEVNGGFSVQGWEWTCSDPEAIPFAPIGGGVWSVSKEASHAKGCFPSYLFQRLPGVQNGDMLTLSGWARCSAMDEFSICMGARIGFGSVNNGIFQVEEAVVADTTAWTFLSVTDTIELQAGDTAIVVLNSGFAGGPVNPVPGWFDELSVTGAEGIDQGDGPQVAHYPDPVIDVIHIAAVDQRILSIDIVDLSGRIVLTARGGSGTQHVDVSSLRSGGFIARVFTPSGETRFPFLKR